MTDGEKRQKGGLQTGKGKAREKGNEEKQYKKEDKGQEKRTIEKMKEWKQGES